MGLRLVLVFFTLLLIEPSTQAQTNISGQLADLVKDYSAIRKVHPNLIPNVDGKRFVSPIAWTGAKVQNEAPWLTYGDVTFNDWWNGAKWISRNADTLPFDMNLYDRLEKMVLAHHYYAGFETRRINAAVTEGKLSKESGENMIKRINQGERVYFSGVDHRTLTGTYRQDPLDEFQHNGAFGRDGNRYLTGAEIENARRNPLLQVDEASLVKVGDDQFKGTIYYPRIKDLKPLTEMAFYKINKKLSESTSLEAKVKAIVEFRIELMTIHRSLDGNGRVIRLLEDLLLNRLGLPPTLTPFENDIFGSFEDVYASIIWGMKQYIRNLKFRTPSPTVPLVLFHWTTDGSYEWMLKNRKSLDQAPMQTTGPSFLVKAFPALKDRAGTHVWINPIKAMHGGVYKNGDIEWYSKPDRQPVLIGYFMKPDATVQAIRSVGDKVSQAGISFEGIDVVYHQHVDENHQLLYHEWIILNPEAVKRWTSDPRELKDHIEKAQERERVFRKTNPEHDSHVMGWANPPQNLIETKNQILNKFLSGPKPSRFSSQTPKCLQLVH